MTVATGIIRKRAEEALWAWPASRLRLGPDEAVFFLRKPDRVLVRVELSGSDPRTVGFEPGCEGFVVSRDFGVRLRRPCEFSGGTRGEIDAEVRLRLLDRAAEWPRRLPQTAAVSAAGGAGDPEEALGRLFAALFEAEIAGFAAGKPQAEFIRRLNDPLLLEEAEGRLRHALARWTEEGILTVLAVHLLGANLREGEGPAPDEVRWRLYEPADLMPPRARPPRLLKESSAPYEALVSGQHLQLVVRPMSAGHVHVLALGPYRAGAGTEYRWMRLFGNEGRSDLQGRAPRAGGNRLEAGQTLLFPGDAGAAQLFQHYLTVDAAPGWESLVVAISPRIAPAPFSGADLPRPPDPGRDFRAYQDELNRGLQSTFGTDARIYLFQFFHS